MTEWLHAPARAAELLSAPFVDGECPVLVLGIEHVVKARSLPSTDLSSEGLEALRHVKSPFKNLGMRLAVTAHRNHLQGQRPFHKKNH